MKYDKSTAQVKGSEILEQVKKLIEKSTTDKDEHFYINRYVHARLHEDEKREKKTIKARIFNDKPQCYFCGETFASIKGVNLHRKDDSRRYEEGNCVLACEKCHKAEHSKTTGEPNTDIASTDSSTTRPKSISGKHKNIRHLVEESLDENPDITAEEMKKAVLEEFPTSAFDKAHYSWYINKIIVNGEWKYG
ncbi:MAG: HNH endonuclease [Deltaproteobacteria bacterium]|nr:HNH endonuclease [Deltaproteobacteria bacterium]